MSTTVEKFPSVNDQLLHELAIEYLKMKYSDDELPHLSLFLRDYLNTRVELFEQHSKLYSEYLNNHVKNNY